MALTREFRQTVRERAARDPGFRRALQEESVTALLQGDVDAGKAVLRDYINATVGFEKLGFKTRIPAKSLIRMLGPKGNPQARNLLDVVAALQKEEGVHLSVASKARRKA